MHSTAIPHPLQPLTCFLYLWGFLFIFLHFDFHFNSIVVSVHTLYDLNPFIFMETYFMFMIPNMVYHGKCSICT